MDGDAGLIEAAAVKTEKCLWGGDEFEPRKGSSPQRFLIGPRWVVQVEC